MVISEDFICKKAPMQELHELLQLQQQTDGATGYQICPIFHGLSVDQCNSRERIMAVYEQRASTLRPATDVMESNIADLKLLTSYTGLRQDQVGHSCNHCAAQFCRKYDVA